MKLCNNTPPQFVTFNKHYGYEIKYRLSCSGDIRYVNKTAGGSIWKVHM